MAANPHNKIINTVARRVLKPLGLTRVGSSRTWVEDHGWWLIVVDYEPSSFSKGTRISVSVSWLLYETIGFGRSVGGRLGVGEHHPYRNDEQFTTVVEEITAAAADEVQIYRRQFESIQSAAHHFLSEPRHRPWGDYYAGVVLGLAGHTDESRASFEKLLAEDAPYEWMKAQHQKACDLLDLLDEPDRFRRSVLGTVYRARSLAALDEWEGEIRFD